MRQNIFRITTLSLAFLATARVPITAHEYDSGRPDGHAPIMVMGDHTHSANDWMVSVRHMRMDMEGMRSSETNLSSQEAFAANYTVTPTNMTMDMTMVGIMSAPSNRVTLMAMIPYIDTEMDHEIFPMAAPLIALNGGSTQFTTRSSGWGDLKIAGLFPFFQSDEGRAHFGLGISLPTGSIGEKDLIPGPGGRLSRQMPAPMQLGSGTVDLLPSITYVRQQESWSIGWQARAIARIDDNHHGYRLGNQIDVSSWVSTKLSNQLSLSGRLRYNRAGELQGTQSDIAFNPPFAPSRRTVTTAFSENYGGQRIDAAIGLNFIANESPLTDNRFAIEYSVPIFEDLNGFQLSTKSIVTVGWQFAW